MQKITKYPSLAALCRTVSPVEWSTPILRTSAGIWTDKLSPDDFIDNDDGDVLVTAVVELSKFSDLCNKQQQSNR